MRNKVPVVLAPRWTKNDLWKRARAVPSLDLRFAENKSLVDSVSGQNLITFTRASTGTFVDSDGVIRSATTNLLLRSEEFDNASWTKGASTTVTANQAVSPDGAQSADRVQMPTGVGTILSQAVTVSSGITYTASLYARATSGASYLTLQLGTNTQEWLLTTAWQRISISFTTNSTTLTFAVDNGAYEIDVLLWGAQLEQSSTVGPYIPTTSTINSAPRFDHNPLTGECLGLLVEEQRQNLLLRSEEFDNAAWTPLGMLAFGSGSTANATAAPNGTTTADLLTEDTSTGEHRVSTGSVVWVGSTTYTFSIFAKSNGRARLDFFGVGGGNFTGGREADFNLATGTVTSTDGATASIQAFANGWYRLRMTFVTSAAPSASGIFIRFSDALGNFSYTGDGTSGIYLWGAQLEAGAFPTSYIGPTTTTAITRTADVVSCSGTNFSSWYRQDEGTVFADVALISSGGRYFMFDNGATTTERWEARFSGFLAAGNSWSNSIQDVGVNTAVTSPASNIRVAFANASNNAAIASNGAGTLLGTDSSSTMPANQTRMFIGSFQGTATYANGPIRRLTYWPARLNNSILQSLTQ
jgi:hypothetical protein